MKKMLLIITLLIMPFTSGYAAVYTADSDEMKLIKNIEVDIFDGVKDGCLANPNALQTEAELILRKKIGMIGFPPYYFLNIDTNGVEQKHAGGTGTGICSVYLDIELYRIVPAPEGHIIPAVVFKRGALLTGSTKVETQSMLRQLVSEFISELANEILKARQE